MEVKQVSNEINCNNRFNGVKKKLALNKELITIVREIVLQKIDQHPHLFNSIDVDRVRQDDWFVNKFIIYRRRDVHCAVDSLIATLKWRQSEGVHEIKESDLPDIYHRLGSFFLYQTDKNGRKVFYLRAKHYQRNSDLRPLVIKSGIALGCKIERDSPEGVIGVMDFRDLQLTKAFDLEIIRILIDILTNHFPLLVRSIYVLNLPYFLQKFSSMLMNIMPAKSRSLIKFLNQKDLPKFIDIHNIPDFLGGKCDKPYKGPKMVPPQSPTLIQYAHRNCWTNKQYLSIYKIAHELATCEGVEPPPPPEMYTPAPDVDGEEKKVQSK